MASATARFMTFATGSKENEKAEIFTNTGYNRNRYFFFLPRTVLPISDDTERKNPPYAVILIIAVNIIFFIVQNIFFYGDKADFFYEECGLVPHLALNSIPKAYSFISSMFVHAGFMHLIGNMWFLWIFGDNVEDYFGHIKFIGLYLFFGLCADTLYIAFHPESLIPVVGASGAIAGAMGAYLALYPSAKIRTLCYGYVVNIPAFVYLGLWCSMQLFFAYAYMKSGNSGGIAWYAHIGGFLSGIAAVLLSKIFKSVSKNLRSEQKVVT
jgi:membrane associated rhomboid family serine protease